MIVVTVRFRVTEKTYKFSPRLFDLDSAESKAITTMQRDLVVARSKIRIVRSYYE